MQDEDVTKLTDEELDQRLEGNQEEVAESPEASEDTSQSEEVETTESEPEEKQEEPEAKEEAPEETATEEKPEEEQKPPSRRETLRIQQILAKRQEEKQEPSQPKREDALNYEEALDADPEVIKQLEDDRRREADTQYTRGLEEAKSIEWRTGLKIDAPTVEKKYPILDKSSSEFHPAVADAVNNWYLQMSGYDPKSGRVANSDIGYADFVDSYMELVTETAGQKAAKSSKNIAKQAASTGLRPDGSTAKRLDLSKPPQQMSDEELEAVIAKAGLATRKNG